MIRGWIGVDGVLHLVGEFTTERYALIKWSEDETKQLSVNDCHWNRENQCFYRKEDPPKVEEKNEEDDNPGHQAG